MMEHSGFTAESTTLQLQVMSLQCELKRAQRRATFAGRFRQLALDLETRDWGKLYDAAAAFGQVCWILWLCFRLFVSLARGRREHTVIEVARIPRSMIWRIEVRTLFEKPAISTLTEK